MASSKKELSEIKKLSESIGKSFDELAEKSDKRNKSLQKEAKTYKDISDTVDDIDSGMKAILAIEERRAKNKTKEFGINNAIAGDMENIAKGAEGALTAETNRLGIVQQVNTVTDDIAKSSNDQVDSIKDMIKEVPVLGNMFAKLIPSDFIKSGIDATFGAFKKGFSQNFKLADIKSKGFSKSFSQGLSGGMASFSKAAARIGPMLAGPQGIIAAIVILLGLGLVALYKVEKAARAFRDETGLLNSQTEELNNKLNQTYMSTVALGASMEDVSKAASEFTNEFKGLEQPSQSVLENMVVLNKNFGVGVSEASKVNKIFQNMAGLSAEQAQSLVASTVQMAQMAGVAPSKVIKDIADNTEYAYKYFQGNSQELAKAAVKAAKLGTNLSEVGKVADGLLDFQSSITNELEASSILGTNLNFSQSRYLAANGKVLEAQQAMVTQVSKLGDLTKLNTFEQQALEKATGMTMESLVDQQRIRERFGKLDEERLGSAMALMKSGKDLSKMTISDLDKQTAAMAKQQEMQGQFESMGNQIKGAFSGIIQSLMPLGTFLMALLLPVFQIAKGFFGAIGNAINNIMQALTPIKQIFTDIFGEGEGLGQVFEFIGKILSYGIVMPLSIAANAIKIFVSKLMGIWKVLKGIFTLDFGLIVEGFSEIGEAILRTLLSPFAILWEFLNNLFPSIGDWFMNLFSNIGSYISSTIGNLLPSWASKLIGLDTSSDSGGGTEPVMMAEGGIVQSPVSAIVGEAGPEAVIPLDKLSGGIGTDMSGVIAELQSLKQAFLSNKDVYMDKSLVTSAVTNTQERSGRENRFGLQGA